MLRETTSFVIPKHDPKAVREKCKSSNDCDRKPERFHLFTFRIDSRRLPPVAPADTQVRPVEAAPADRSPPER
jgi:hypothetical protein